MILMAPCIIDFIGANALLGPVGGRGPGHSWALKWHRAKRVPFGPREREREQRKSKRERGDVYTTRVQMALTLAV
jgi:hypothetical protein